MIADTLIGQHTKSIYLDDKIIAQSTKGIGLH